MSIINIFVSSHFWNVPEPAAERVLVRVFFVFQYDEEKKEKLRIF